MSYWFCFSGEHWVIHCPSSNLLLCFGDFPSEFVRVLQRNRTTHKQIYIYMKRFPWWLSGKESSCNGGGVDVVLIPGSGRSLQEGMATHSSILGWWIPWLLTWRAAVHRVTKSDVTDLTEHEHMCRDLLWGIGSCDYRDWEVPQFVVCKLETHGNQWCNSTESLIQSLKV